MEDLLELIAQLAITVAALSAVAGATRGNSVDVEHQYLLRDVALIGMAVALYSVIPLLLDEAGVDSDLTITVCGGLAALSWTIGYLLYVLRIRNDKQHFTGLFFLGLLLTLGGLGSFFYSAVAEHEVAYLSGLVFWLAIASLNFINGVFSIPTPDEDHAD